MPELMPVWERLVALVREAGCGDLAARFLTLYRPPPFLTGCSLLATSDPLAAEPVLVRNYDYSPRLCEGALMRTQWHGRPVIAMSDCLWGALDGVNDSGLCVALAFGGRKVVGDGFGIPLVLRYILEFCDTTRDAVRVLTRVPVHMAYNVTVVDERGKHATVQLAPDREPLVTDRRAATNHQGPIEWPEHAAITRSEEREAAIDACLAGGATSLDDLVSRFLHHPIYSSAFHHGWGTLYTAHYDPARRAAAYLWPHARMDQSIDSFTEREVPIHYA